MTTNSPPSILHICKVYHPEKGGVQKVVRNITSMLSDFQHSVITTGPDGAIDCEEIDRAKVWRCRSYGQIASMPIAPSLVSRVARQAHNHQLVVVHYPFPLAELALLFALRTPPIIVHWHSEIIAQKKLKWLVAPLTLILLLRARAIVVTSEKMLGGSWFLRRFKRKISFIPYGMPAVSPPTVKPPLRDAYFLIVGRHVSYKGINVALRAIKNSKIRLFVVGDGPLYDQHFKLAKDLGLLDRVEFDRHASDDQVIELIQHCVALVVPSVMNNEAFALVQLEAMRLGKALINTGLQTSVPWVARHLQEAITVPAGDIDALAAAMQQLSSDPELAERLGTNGLSRFQQKFSADQFSRAIKNLYSAAIRRDQPGGKQAAQLP